jgi:2-amino-4-hydroxy-6-hydroxymethyldihydropteridine diphosphokinase
MLAAIALGTNLGDREANLRTAIAHIAALGQVLAVSSFRDTEPVGYLDQPRFLNGALLLETRLPPLELLRALLAIELEMGRRRDLVAAKGPRVIDLDLLFVDAQVLETPELTLPHPALPERVFVLEPLAEIAAGWVHPTLHCSVAEMLATL